MRTPTRRSRAKVTIDDVALRAGVSAMTVSRVVNAEKNVHPATRELVLKVVRELNYAPNLAARSLAKADDIRIGLIYSNPSAAYLSEFLVGALDESTSRGARNCCWSRAAGRTRRRRAAPSNDSSMGASAAWS